MYEFDIIILLI